jgi:hypothetical protein
VQILFSDNADYPCYLSIKVRGWNMFKIFILAMPLLLGGCITSVVKEVVTAPVKIVSKTADVMTTSQSEADEKRGRDLRKREEALGKLARKRDKAREDCADGEKDACERYEELEREIEEEKDRSI